jgi:hypothetical protein
MPTKTENALAPLLAQLQMRDAQLYQAVIEFAGNALSGESANKLISIVRNAQASIDMKAELTVLATSLQSTT